MAVPQDLTVGAKLASFALVLAVAFGLGAAVGRAAGPIDVGTPSTSHTNNHSSHEHP